MEEVILFTGFKPRHRIRIPTKDFKLDNEIELFIVIGSKLCNTNYLLNQSNEKAIVELLKYLNGHDCIFNINKGIALLGPTGTGKSKLFDVMRDYIIQRNIKYIVDDQISNFSFKQYSAHEAVAQFANYGFKGIYTFTYFTNIQFDDLGAEIMDVNNFGNKLNVFQYIIEERYRYNKLTHFTSNLTKSDLKNKYGDRVFSRLNEMVHFIEITGDDFRLNL